MKALLRLYPSAWRARYEAEMTALLEQRGRRLSDAIDLVRAALDAHRQPVGDAATHGGTSMSPGNAGWAAVIGGLLWSFAYLAVWLTARVVSWANQGTGQGIAPSEGQIWLAGLLVAPALLVAAQMWISRSLAWRRPRSWIPAISALAASVMIAKLLLNIIRPDRRILGEWGQAELWVVAMLVLAMASFAFGLALLATGAVQRPAVALLLIGASLNAAFLAITGAAHMMTALRYAEGVVASGALFGLGWTVVGVALIRRHPVAVADTLHQEDLGPAPEQV